MTTHIRPARFARKGIAVAALIIVLALINVVVIGVIAAGGDESEDALSRVESSRAFYASESGTRIALKCLNASLPPPITGSSIMLGTAKVRYVQVPTGTGAGTIIIEATSGSAVRRTRVVIDAQ